MSDLQAVRMEGFVLSPEDVTELLPDATQAEMEGLATLTTDYLMNYWQECLEEAVTVIKGDRRTR